VGHEWHTIVRTVEMSGCCVLCRTRHALRKQEPAVPSETTVSINGCHRRVIMVPMPIRIGTDESVSFLVLDPEKAGDTDAELKVPTPIHSRVRHLEDSRMIDQLTIREREVLACVVNGSDARSIASKLGISHATARNYVQRILSKLGVRNKAEAVMVALTYNLLAS
jgi:DNA-binding CsgD family transcriptional regulator